MAATLERPETSPAPPRNPPDDGPDRLPPTNRLTTQAGLEKLSGYPYQIVTWVADDGFPVSVAVEARIDPDEGTASFDPPAGLTVPSDREVSLTGSHIRPQPGYGYDERRHVTVWGRVSRDPDGELALVGTAAWGWDEAEVPFFEYSERNVGRARSYFDALSAERGTPVRPRLSFGFLALRATRLPFLSATVIPTLLGILVAAVAAPVNLWLALLTVVGGSLVHLGLNVANDVFDTRQGADELNVTPTQYSGGSRVIQYGLVSIRRMALISAAMYAGALAIGLYLLASVPSTALLVIGVTGIVVSVGYTAPPLKLVYRGLGEIAVALGFGPLMVLGAYVVQTGGSLAWEPLVASIPVAILVALILYVNEIPDRRGDARAGKRTLPVRWSKSTVIHGYGAAATVAFGVIPIGVALGILPWPTIIALAAAPLAVTVYRGLWQSYDQPYVLMAFMGTNVRLHLATGGLLLLAYLAVIVVGALALDLPMVVSVIG
jgi:1,4-dihydroxy-2-naphthoate octaprenyltransferase